MASYHMVIAERSKMTDAAKWKEFLRWWEAGMRDVANLLYSANIVIVIDGKIKKLQKGANARQ